jgi:hypothetical protein
VLAVAALTAATASASAAPVIGVPRPSLPQPVAPLAATGRPAVREAKTLAGAPYVSRNLILLPGGSRLVVKGVAVYMMPFYSTTFGGRDNGLAATADRNFQQRDAIFGRLQALGFNAVRLPLGSDAYASDTYGLGGSAGQLARIQQIVASAEAHGLYVLIGWWDSLDSGGSLLADYARPFQMMADVRGALGEDPHVMYEPFNEPNQVSWNDWQAAMAVTIRFWRAELAYRGILVVDTVNWSWDFDPSRARTFQQYDASFMGGRPNIVFANHRYANTNACFCGVEEASFATDVAQYASTFPIVGTEYGFWNDEGPPQPMWNAQFFSYLATTAVPRGFNGAWFFLWNWVDPNSMTNTDALTLNEFGWTAVRNFVAVA